MNLYFKKLGDGPNLIILHGLYGSSDNWLSIAKNLSAKFTVYLVDQRNHGRSPHSDEHSYKLMSEDLKELMDKNNIRTSSIIGHSMGGKTAMTFAVKYHERVENLVVVDISPRPYKSLTDFEQHPIDHLNIINALDSVDLSLLKTRQEIELFLEKPIPEKNLRGFLMKNLNKDEEGNLFWALNIKSLKQNLSLIMDGLEEKDFGLDRSIHEFPVLFLKGEKSNYISEKDYGFIKSLFPRAEIASIPNAGHWLHAEQQTLFLKTVSYFLSD